MGLCRRGLRALLVVAISLLPAPAEEGSAQEGTGTVVYRAGASEPVRRSRARVLALHTGHPAGEPTIGIGPERDIFVPSADWGESEGIEVLRSQDGVEWKVVSPRIEGTNTHPLSLDPYIHVDPTTGRVFTVDLTLACSILSFSDDRGASWTTNPLACGRPVNDHQTLFTGSPTTSTPVAYENVVYYCFNDVATSTCTKSLDGGVTFVPTGSPAFATGTGLCGGLHGHGTSSKDGTIFLPKEHCGEPWLAISKDEGATWERVRVSRADAARTSDPSVAVDRQGHIYYAWLRPDRLVYLVRSKDGGQTWTKPVRISAPAVTEANFPTIAIGPDGELGLAYLGSTDSPFQSCVGKDTCSEPYSDVSWRGHVAVSRRPARAKPRFVGGSFAGKRGPLARGTCGPGRCYPIWDFIDVALDARGLWAAFVDGSVDARPGEGIIGHLPRG